jgi:hypothetical protein
MTPLPQSGTSEQIPMQERHLALSILFTTLGLGACSSLTLTVAEPMRLGRTRPPRWDGA